MTPDDTTAGTSDPLGVAADPEMVRGEDGRWCYAGTDIAVPGATDLTLADVMRVRSIVRNDRPEAVIVSSGELAASDELAWVRDVGRRLTDDRSADEYLVPWDVWQEHAARPVSVRAPERDADGIARAIAIAERQVRLARMQLEQRLAQRGRCVAIAVGIGLTRREIGLLLGLSPTRVQQMSDGLSPDARTEVETWLRDAVAVLREIGGRAVGQDALASPAPPELIEELVTFGLLERRDRALQCTPAGEAAELHLRRPRRR